MLPQLMLAGRRPGLLVAVLEPGDQPSQLRQRMAFPLRLAADVLLQPGPALLAVLTGDGRLSVVQRGKLASGQAAFRLKLEVPQAWPTRQRTRPTWHGSASSRPGADTQGARRAERPPCPARALPSAPPPCPRREKRKKKRAR